MQWLTKLVDEIVARHPDGEILIESGASPSGTYHFGHLREILTCDAVLLELLARGRQARHVHFVDDLDALRKIPVNVPADYDQYLGRPLCDIPAPDGSNQSYGDFMLSGFLTSARVLGIEMEVIHSHEKYRAGFFTPAIEKALSNIGEAKKILEDISGRELDDTWSGMQVMEDGYLKTRQFVSLDTDDKILTYRDKDGNEQTISYADGLVKLDWRLDWPGRWWLMNVHVEPFGRDHASAGGSYDTGAAIVTSIYGANAPLPVPYDFINRAGDTKKMSASKGTGVAAEEAVKVLPAEVLRYFVLQAPPSKRLYFDAVDGTIRLVDEYAELLAKSDKTEEEKRAIAICQGSAAAERVVSRVPFSLLANSYQAALKDVDKTIEIISRTEYSAVAAEDKDVVGRELQFIDAWLEHWAPEDVKFSLLGSVNQGEFTDQEKEFFGGLAEKISSAPEGADGEWFHKAIYEFKESHGMEPRALFSALYRLLIGKTAGPRAGWFLSILPREWLVKRLCLES